MPGRTPSTPPIATEHYEAVRIGTHYALQVRGVGGHFAIASSAAHATAWLANLEQAWARGYDVVGKPETPGERRYRRKLAAEAKRRADQRHARWRAKLKKLGRA